MEKTLLVATHNEGKVTELARLLAGRPVRWLTLNDAGIVQDVAETGATMRDNAILKAETYARQAGLLTLADDSGLEVDALDGAPGVYSARFGGPSLDDVGRYELLLRRLANMPSAKRTARFRCVMALAGPDGRLLGTVEGVCEGAIATEPRGQGGFGYDPVFIVAAEGRTMAELSASEKNALSHRGRALQAMLPLLRAELGT